MRVRIPPGALDGERAGLARRARPGASFRRSGGCPQNIRLPVRLRPRSPRPPRAAAHEARRRVVFVAAVFVAAVFVAAVFLAAVFSAAFFAVLLLALARLAAVFSAGGFSALLAAARGAVFFAALLGAEDREDVDLAGEVRCAGAAASSGSAASSCARERPPWAAFTLRSRTAIRSITLSPAARFGASCGTGAPSSFASTSSRRADW